MRIPSMSKRIFIAALMMAGLAFSAPLVHLNFAGLQPGEEVLNFYNGGLGGNASGPGTDYGISFSVGLALRVVRRATPPIGTGLDAILTALSVVMTFDNLVGPENLLSFYFLGPVSATFYSGANATGSVVGIATGIRDPFSAQAMGPYQNQWAGDDCEHDQHWRRRSGP